MKSNRKKFLRNSLPLNQNVYDAATWSEISVAKNLLSLISRISQEAIRKPINHMTLNGEATTGIRQIKTQTKM